MDQRHACRERADSPATSSRSKSEFQSSCIAMPRSWAMTGLGGTRRAIVSAWNRANPAPDGSPLCRSCEKSSRPAEDDAANFIWLRASVDCERNSTNSKTERVERFRTVSVSVATRPWSCRRRVHSCGTP